MLLHNQFHKINLALVIARKQIPVNQIPMFIPQKLTRSKSMIDPEIQKRPIRLRLKPPGNKRKPKPLFPKRAKSLKNPIMILNRTHNLLKKLPLQPVFLIDFKSILHPLNITCVLTGSPFPLSHLFFPKRINSKMLRNQRPCRRRSIPIRCANRLLKNSPFHIKEYKFNLLAHNKQ